MVWGYLDERVQWYHCQVYQETSVLMPIPPLTLLAYVDCARLDSVKSKRTGTAAFRGRQLRKGNFYCCDKENCGYLSFCESESGLFSSTSLKGTIFPAMNLAFRDWPQYQMELIRKMPNATAMGNQPPWVNCKSERKDKMQVKLSCTLPQYRGL